MTQAGMASPTGFEPVS